MSKTPTFARSWQLFTCAFRLVGQRKSLLLFPILSVTCGLLLAGLFLVPMVFQPTGHAWSEFAHWKAVGHMFLNHNGHLTRTGYFYFAAVYLPLMVCATFFNVAFCHQIMQALAGEGVTLGAGLRFACRRWRSILYWSLFAGLVGLLIQLLSERLGWVGRLGWRLTGMAWSVASVFVIPVMIREEDSNPIGLLRHSAATLRRTWGESLVGFVGIRLFSGLVAVLFGLAMFILATTYLPGRSDRTFLIAMSGPVLAVFFLQFFSTTAGHIYRCALYIYASEGVIPAPFSEEQMHQAWKVRGGSTS